MKPLQTFLAIVLGVAGLTYYADAVYEGNQRKLLRTGGVGAVTGLIAVLVERRKRR